MSFRQVNFVPIKRTFKKRFCFCVVRFQQFICYNGFFGKPFRQEGHKACHISHKEPTNN